MPSGFYYKTFIAPNWHWYEWLIRAAAGLGRSPRAEDPDRYDKRFETVDVLVVGAGPAGIRAALEHGKTGHQVLVVDDQPVPGGSLLYADRSEEHTSELQSLMRISYAVFCLKKKKNTNKHYYT